MTRAHADETPSLWPEQWAIHASVQAERIEYQMRMAKAARAPLTARQHEAVHAIEDLLRSVRQATARRRRPRWLRWWRWRGPLDRWRGTSVERAYQSLHAAKIFLVELLADEEVDALAPGVVARAATILNGDDPRRVEMDQLVRMERGPSKRAALQQAMELAYEASDQLHVRVRSFRNILFVSALLILFLMGGLVAVVAAHPTAIPLCFTPSVPVVAPAAPGAQPDRAEQPQVARTVCPSGDRQRPSRGDVAIVAGLGLLGGALAAAFAIRKIRGSSAPYDIPIAVAVLKVPSGSLTAVAGILLLGGSFVPGLSELDSQRQILAYALLLGYAQELGTRFIDDRAQSILNSLPSKDPEGKQPTPALPSVPVGPVGPVGPAPVTAPAAGTTPSVPAPSSPPG